MQDLPPASKSAENCAALPKGTSDRLEQPVEKPGTSYIEMIEQRLPPTVLNKATLRGNEYAWPLSTVEEVVTAARESGLANLGGQVQFRILEGTCDLYWLEVDSGGRRPGEKWQDYVARTATEVLSRFRLLQSRYDFVNEGLSFSILRQMHDRGVPLDQFLCFVLYFEEEASRPLTS
jgi:hypothetical protein